MSHFSPVNSYISFACFCKRPLLTLLVLVPHSSERLVTIYKDEPKSLKCNWNLPRCRYFSINGHFCKTHFCQYIIKYFFKIFTFEQDVCLSILLHTTFCEYLSIFSFAAYICFLFISAESLFPWYNGLEVYVFVCKLTVYLYYRGAHMTGLTRGF